MEQKVVKTVVKNSVKKNNQVVVEKISHIKQHSIDSGVGSQMGSSHGIIPNGSSNTLRTRPVSLSNSQKIQHVRSISENALLTSPQFSIYEKVHIINSSSFHSKNDAFDRQNDAAGHPSTGSIKASTIFDTGSIWTISSSKLELHLNLLNQSNSEHDGFRRFFWDGLRKLSFPPYFIVIDYKRAKNGFQIDDQRSFLGFHWNKRRFFVSRIRVFRCSIPTFYSILCDITRHISVTNGYNYVTKWNLWWQNIWKIRWYWYRKWSELHWPIISKSFNEKRF